MVAWNRFLASASVGLSAAAIAPLVILQSAMPAAAASFSQIYAFGDSLVDTGNAFAQTGIPPAPYFNGRFANGPVLPDYLATDLGLPVTSFGYGGAFTGQSGSLLGIPVPGTLAQVDAFTTSVPVADENALYVLWAGSNDYINPYLSGNPFDPLQPLPPVNNLLSAITSLSGVGAKNFLVANLPDLGNLPRIGLLGAPPSVVAALNDVSERHNQDLAAELSALNSLGNIDVTLLDANSLIRDAMAGNAGFTNTTDPCIFTPSCLLNPVEQSNYLFWDDLHPTTQAHRLVANEALTLLHPPAASVPEPATCIGLILVGGLGLSQLKRKSPAA